MNQDFTSPQRFDELDVEQRLHLRQTQIARDRDSLYRFWRYFLATARSRLLPRPPQLLGHPQPVVTPSPPESPVASHTIDIDALLSRGTSGGSLLPIPLGCTRVVERLGCINMLSIVDDELICESSFPEEIFLLNAKDSEAQSSTFGVMYDPTVGKLKFEDVYWWKQMSSLKPLGFACVMTEAAPPPLLATTSFDVTSGMIDDFPAAYPDDSLVRYCTLGMSKKNLGRLGRDIGFSDQDMSLFADRCRIYVTAPHLVDELVMEDLHALSQEESRMRGTLQPHLTAVVLEDRRNGGLQLVSHGNPALALPMCSEYWDGLVITAFSAEERRLVLETYQQWTQADFDVVALTFTPVPTYMQRVLTERGDDQGRNLPMYMVDNYTEEQLAAHLIEIREQSNKERAARLAMCEVESDGVTQAENQEAPMVAASKEDEGDGRDSGVLESKSRLSSSYRQSSPDHLADMAGEVVLTVVMDEPASGPGIMVDDLASRGSMDDAEGGLMFSPATALISSKSDEVMIHQTQGLQGGDKPTGKMLRSQSSSGLSASPASDSHGMRFQQSKVDSVTSNRLTSPPPVSSTTSTADEAAGRTVKRMNSGEFDILYKGKKSSHNGRNRVPDDNVMWDVLQKQVDGDPVGEEQR